jgi:hypothetical protein
VQHQLAGWPCAGGQGDGAIAVEPGVVHQGGEALLQAAGVGVGAGRLGTGLQAQAAGVVAGQIKQVAHERAHALGFLLDQLQGGGLGTAAQQGPRRGRRSG